MFLKKHWTFSKIPRDVFFKTTVSFFSGFYPVFYTKKGCIKTFFLTQPFRLFLGVYLFDFPSFTAAQELIQSAARHLFLNFFQLCVNRFIVSRSFNITDNT